MSFDKISNIELLANKFFIYTLNYFIKNSSDDSIDLTKCNSFRYSSVLRELRKNGNKNIVKEFQIIFNNYFNEAIKNGERDLDKIALLNSLNKLAINNKIKIRKDFIELE